MSTPVWQMVRSAMEHFNREVSYTEIIRFIEENWPDTKPVTIRCQLISSTVNVHSRIYYGSNKTARLATTDRDFLYSIRPGKVCPYVPEKHGEWEIYQKQNGEHSVRQVTAGIEDLNDEDISDAQSGSFALESHLRDYLARNLNSIGDFGTELTVFVDSEGVDGIEYHTEVGIIDILTRSDNGDFYVFELKLGRGPDAALGQILRYMGWVDKHLSGENEVHGIVLASEISKKLKYAVTQVNNVRLFEYQLNFSVKPSPSC